MATSNEPARRPWADSPWFWLAVFSAAAWLALWGIGGKYARRQFRLEQKFAHRVQTWNTRDARSPTPVAAELPTVAVASPRPRSALAPLHWALAATLVVALWRLWLGARTAHGAGP